MRTVCVFCGSASGTHTNYRQSARELGELLARQNITLMYGGAQIGLMGAVADATLAAGGRVIGVIPQSLLNKEVGHRGLTEQRVVRTMAERKEVMIELSDAFIALPGGIGTLDELFEVWTTAQLGVHAKPCGLLNVRGYFDGLLRFLDHTVTEGFLRSDCRRQLFQYDNAVDLLAALRAASAQ